MSVYRQIDSIEATGVNTADERWFVGCFATGERREGNYANDAEAYAAMDAMAGTPELGALLDIREGRIVTET